jgi:hypothetical protein
MLDSTSPSVNFQPGVQVRSSVFQMQRVEPIEIVFFNTVIKAQFFSDIIPKKNAYS